MLVRCLYASRAAVPLTPARREQLSAMVHALEHALAG